ncbi:unnamed protein product, partial [marine sediment metagenome]
DCGKGSSENPESDASLTCIGENLIQNCTPSKAIIKSETNEEITYSVLGNIENKCFVRIEFPSEDKLPSESKEYAEKYVKCPISQELIDSYKDEPGVLADNVITNVLINSISGNPLNCTGTLLQNLFEYEDCETGLLCDFGDGYSCYGAEYQQILQDKINECNAGETLTCKTYFSNEIVFTDTNEIIGKTDYNFFGETRLACQVKYKKTYPEENNINNQEDNCYYSLVDSNTMTCIGE